MFEIIEYEDKFEDRWDRFIKNDSINGTFLQSRDFLNYHPQGRFVDASLLVIQGSSIVAVIPACKVEDDYGKHFVSHKGSTFGGIVLHKEKYNIKTLQDIFLRLEQYLKDNHYVDAKMSQTSDIFSKKEMDLLDYFYYKQGWKSYSEISFYVDIEKAPDDLLRILSSSRRRDYKYSLKHDLQFRRLQTDHEIEEFHSLLSQNLKKFGAKPVHSVNELLEFKNKRLVNIVDFYGVYKRDAKLVAATMLFYFGKNVLHTQYLAQSQNKEDLNLYAMEFLNYNTMLLAREKGFKKFSFGISTEDQGKVLNIGLATFKEGFGCDYCNNKTYIKQFNKYSGGNGDAGN
ncbi:MAG: GNAT family N-acetyltransferase [Lachnospiraceae bacterium]|nr:GNAT family N-acetyltransferase [Lachnospiraceae bacterium]